MKAILSLLTLLLAIPLYGNDGVYLTRGGVFYPISESKISLEKEILSFRAQDKMCRVDILFEFNNPESVDRKLIVGFQAPSAYGDVTGIVRNTSQITNFEVVSNGEVLPYKLKKAKGENGELKDPEDIQFEDFDPAIFIYLFELTFKPGSNTINHSYSFPASTNVTFNQFYNYILTTGSKWADGKIKDLSVRFDMGDNKYFYVHDVFDGNAKWSIVGSGKMTNESFHTYPDVVGKMVRINSGILQIDVADLEPKKNIEFGIINENTFSTALEIGKHDKLVTAMRLLTFKSDFYNGDNLTKEDLRLMRNTIYAQHGYVFKNEELQNYFLEFDWYIPNPNLTAEQINLSEKENSFISEILQREKK